MEGEFQLQWEEAVEVKHTPAQEDEEDYVLGTEPVESFSNMQADIQETEQMAAENLMYLSQDAVYTEAEELECVTEEVITDDWSHEGQDRVEVPAEYLSTPLDRNVKLENDEDIPLPTDQDEYTAMRPWPCDFCSRRFRKKAALMNHMVAHQTDRPHACNLCGVRYVRKCDLMNHLKVHAYVPDHETMDFEDMLDSSQIVKPKKKRGRRKKNSEVVENGLWEHMTSARTQQWSRRARSPPRRSPPRRSPTPVSDPSPPPPLPPPADPSRPFVCRHCGVAFAREKALQSHARVHGGDSPMECYSCGELCWSREALAQHTRTKHPHQPPHAAQQHQPYNSDTEDDDDMDYRLSPSGSVTSRGSRGGSADRTAPPPALFCEDCGVAFQRADLLRRHVAAAHSYKRQQHDSTSSTWGEHACEVCGETCSDALQLLAHAELHAERHPAAHSRLKKMSRGRNHTSTSSGSKQFPCRECGKVFGSRSSQQIHVRIHTGERPYACRFCWKAFADGGTLRKHERIHTGEKPYACAVCPRAFNQRVVLREHVRSHHSAAERRGGGYSCAVCARQLPSAPELVQHLIQHCDANTALKRQPMSGPRKYKRRRKAAKLETPSPPARDWALTAVESPPPSPAASPPPAPPPPRPTAAAARRRRVMAAAAAPQRPRMIHTEPQPRPRTKQVRQRRPPRHPADDLRAIRPPPARSPSPPAHSPTPPARSPTPPARSPTPPAQSPAASPSPPPDSQPTFKCEMCSLEFTRRDALLLHVPVHI